MTSEGICFFAYNNEQIDYIKLSLFAAKQAKKHLGRDTCLITDDGSYGWLRQSHTKEQILESFSDVIITDDEHERNIRVHHDSPWTEFAAQFSNSNKHKVFEYSPYDKTLLLDIDYIVKSDFLNHAFDSYTGVAMFKDAMTIRNTKMHRKEQRLFDLGIDMWWSTVVYFDKSPESKLFFDTWAHVKDNYQYYKYLYNFPGYMYRTDYCVSIASHILNGMNPGDAVHTIPGAIQNLSSKDDIVSELDAETWTCLSHDPVEPWKNLLVRHENYDVHCMNKRALTRLIERTQA